MNHRKSLSEIARDRRIEIGSVVQLNGNASSACFVGCLMIVTKIHAWGCQGFVSIPQSMFEPAPRAYLRPKWDAMEFVGTAALMPDEPQDQGEPPV